MESGVADTIRKTLEDGFMTLPIVLTGIEFLLGSLTSNVGLLWIFLGHLLVVPSATRIANMFTGMSDATSFLKIAIFTIFNLLILGIIGQQAYEPKPGESSSDAKSYIGIIPILSLIFWPFLVRKFMPGAKAGAESPNCQMFPGAKISDVQQNSITTWSGHVVFFFSFIIANAFYIYTLPDPVLTEQLQDQNAQRERQVKLEERIQNRKNLTILIACVSLILLLALLYIRFNVTGCEPPFLVSVGALGVLGYYAYCWFRVVAIKCGVNPVDILGIVQGMIDPNLLDKPIVCIAEKP